MKRFLSALAGNNPVQASGQITIQLLLFFFSFYLFQFDLDSIGAKLVFFIIFLNDSSFNIVYMIYVEIIYFFNHNF